MFVLPPPPRYPVGGYPGAPPGQLIETNNSISHPTGAEYQLVVGEGTYLLRDDLHLATPPPHPSEAPVHNPNPLATTVSPPTQGTKLSLVALAPRQPSSTLLHRLDTKNSTRSQVPPIAEHESNSHASETDSQGVNGFVSSPLDGLRTPVFGADNAALSVVNGKASKDPAKRNKPKNNIEHNANGVYAFANINRALQWLDLSSPIKEEHLTKILFTKAHALCHDINHVTKGPNHLDIILGFSTGDIIWYEPISQKYSRINKNGIINPTAVSDIRWIPNSENLFMASHMDGSLVVYDKEKEDAAFRKIRLTVKNSKINAFEFSPDRRHFAVVSEDGSFRIMDFLRERLLHHYMSYYGGMMCDDLVSIWSLEDRMLVARCQGHNSWVTGSVGEDTRLLLWDFSVGMLHRPRAASLRPRTSITSSNLKMQRTRTDSSAGRMRSNSNLSSGSALDDDEIVHAVEPRARTAMLPPVLAKSVDDHPLTWLAFEEDCIITSCKNGHIRTWDRPKEGSSTDESGHTRSQTSSSAGLS
ncbi:hypothetical protein ST47_g4683 [Ascochyta rabiei]|uniref:Uncharacterized protein n=1 Tax=Didymella rabiei TaxID=5454 RepID=A0A163F4Y8_DIDRA|nr:hypothetical protein ST47_g4683 [Ascochyta rabiei]